MDKMPKRNRDKYNPYYLQSDVKNNLYRVNFFTGGKEVTIPISKELFYAMDELERLEARQIQWSKRYIERSDLFEITLYERAKNKPLNSEDQAIKNCDYELLEKAIDSLPQLQRRRVFLYYDHNLTLEEIANIEGCSRVAVKYSIERALENMRKFFEKI